MKQNKEIREVLFHEEIKIKDLAESIGVTERTLYKCFAKPMTAYQKAKVDAAINDFKLNRPLK